MKLAYILGGITIIGAGFGFFQWADSVVDSWAQGVEERVQESVGEKLDQQQATLDRLSCAVYYGKPKVVCDCLFVESLQPTPHPERCEAGERLLLQGRNVEARELLAAPDSTR